MPERDLRPSSGWNTPQNVEMEVLGGLLGTQSLSAHHLRHSPSALVPREDVQCDGVP